MSTAAQTSTQDTRAAVERREELREFPAERDDIRRCAMAHFRRLRRVLKRALRAGDRVEFNWPGDEGLEHLDVQLVAEIRLTHLDVRTADGGPVMRRYW